MDENMISDDHIQEATRCPQLGPAYFASRDIAERFMTKFTAEQFKPMVEEFTNQFRDKLWGDIDNFLISDTQSNLQRLMWRQIDQCVRAILSGEKWVVDRYALGDRYDCEKVRAAVAKHVPEELQNARIADLEAENAKLREDLEWARKWRSL